MCVIFVMFVNVSASSVHYFICDTFPTTVANKPFSFRSALKFLYHSMRTEGVLALWRGNSATVTRIVPYAAIQYAAHEQYKILLNPSKVKRLVIINGDFSTTKYGTWVDNYILYYQR